MTDADILARTIYGEARGEKLSGREAVASTVLNRVKFAARKGSYWWGSSIEEVCLKPWQFSCWNKSDPNYNLILKVNLDDENFCICKRIAARACAGLLNDNVNGATHYHTKSSRPGWSIGKIPCAEIGSHFFYNDIER